MTEQEIKEVQLLINWLKHSGYLKEEHIVKRLLTEWARHATYDYIGLNPDEWVPKENVKEILDRLHISDIEPWSTYSVPGEILFDLDELIR